MEIYVHESVKMQVSSQFSRNIGLTDDELFAGAVGPLDRSDDQLLFLDVQSEEAYLFKPAGCIGRVEIDHIMLSIFHQGDRNCERNHRTSIPWY